MTSAKDNKGVNELFMDLCIMLGEKNVEENLTSSVSLGQKN